MFESLDLKGLHVSIFITSIFLRCEHSAFRRWQLFLYCGKTSQEIIAFLKRTVCALLLCILNPYQDSPELCLPHTLVGGEVHKRSHMLHQNLSSLASYECFLGLFWCSFCLECSVCWFHFPPISKALSSSSDSL